MRISDWSSDVCSSDLFLDSLITIVQNEVAKGGAVKLTGFGTFEKAAVAARTGRNPKTGAPIKIPSTHKPKFTPGATFKEIGRASCRERVCPYVEIAVVTGALKKNTKSQNKTAK